MAVVDLLSDFLIDLYCDNNFSTSRVNGNKTFTYGLLRKSINIFNNLHEDIIELLFLTNNIIKILNY